MKIKEGVLFNIIAIGIFVVLKFGYKFSEIENLTFLLKPTDRLIGFIVDSESNYISNSGYYYSDLNVLIDKSCSGFSFFGLTFLMFSFLGLKYFNKVKEKILILSSSLLGAYIITLFVNSSRIYASIVIQKAKIGFFSDYQHLLHESIGIVTNLSFLILIYLITDNILLKNSLKIKVL